MRLNRGWQLRARSLYAAVLTLSLVGFPLVAGLAEAMHIEATGASVAMRGLLDVLSVLVVLHVLARHGRFARTTAVGMLFVFWGGYLLRMYFATTFLPYPLAWPPVMYWVWGVGACLIPAIALCTVPESQAYALAFRWCFALALCAGAVMAGVGGTDVVDATGQMYASGRFRLTALNPISLGQHGVSLVILALWAWQGMSHAKNVYASVMFAVGVALGLYLVIASASRGPLLSLLGALLLWAWATRGRQKGRVMALIICVITAGVVAIIHLTATGVFDTLERVKQAINGDGAAVIDRVQLLRAAIEQFQSSPLIGNSLVDKLDGAYPHNLVIESFMATGVLGGFLFVGVILVALSYAWKLVRWRANEAWIGLLFAQYLVEAQTSGGLYSSTLFWAFLAAVLSAYYSVWRARAYSKLAADSDKVIVMVQGSHRLSSSVAGMSLRARRT